MTKTTKTIPDPNARRQLMERERRNIWKKTNGRCAYCGCKLIYREMTIDHIKPLILGGGNEDENLLPACRSCNTRKGSLTLEKFRTSVEDFPAVLARHNHTYNSAVRFGLVIPNPGRIKFYFEQIGEKQRDERAESF
jgi:hypothetical protein